MRILTTEAQITQRVSENSWAVKIAFVKVTLVTLVLLALPAFVRAQKSVADLKPAHAAELQKYLSKDKSVGFLQEHVIDDETLKDMRKEIRKRMMPYYLTGDFNRDGRPDFAIILSRSGKPKFDSEEEAAARKDDVNLRLVVFNGTKKGFTVAHTEDLEAPLTCFINLSDEKKPRLYFGVFRSDADTFILAPAGRGYIMEFDKSP